VLKVPVSRSTCGHLRHFPRPFCPTTTLACVDLSISLMDRLFTAFVSSTFVDLREERQRLVQVLLRQRCVPLGMEFFPSTGRTQWSLIAESIQAADFCIFVVAGRYGTISDVKGISWTHREFREAVATGKPVVGILHEKPIGLPADKLEASPEGLEKLWQFRREVEAHTVCQYFSDHADLVDRVASSIAALRDEGRIEGWVPAGRNPVVLQESDFDRIYDMVESHYAFAKSDENPAIWDAHYQGRRTITSQDPDGLPAVAIDFTRETDQELPFASDRHPEMRIVDYDRLKGSVLLRSPRKSAGGTFVQDVAFNPPLAPGDSVSFQLEAWIRPFKYGRADDLLLATKNSRQGPRALDWTSRNVIYPTRQLMLSAFLPSDLNATPRGPLIGRTGRHIDHEASNRLASDGSYTCEKIDLDGVEGFLMKLSLAEPRMRRFYRLAWELP
jgi:hypothetical protein